MKAIADNAALWERRLARERGARKQAEQLLEEKSRELYGANLELRALTQNLERLVEERTAELTEARDAALAGSRAKSAFLANMSHEIRTPMSSVIGMAELLLESPLSTDQRQQVKVILESARSLLTIINDILDLSKLESESFRLEEQDFDLFDLVDQVFDILAVPAGAKHLELVAIPGRGLPSWLRGDPVRLRQVLLNLLGNAIKFTDEGGVSLRIDPEEISAERVRLSFAVADSGPGIAPAEQARLFTKFSQLETGPVRRHQGTGLGLAISKGVVERMGGEIGVDSQPGCGSHFWFRVPLAKGQEGGLRQPLVPAGCSVALLIESALLAESITAQLHSLEVQTTLMQDSAALADALERAVHGGEPFALVFVEGTDRFNPARDPRLREALEHCAAHTRQLCLVWPQSMHAGKPGPWDGVIARPLTRLKLLEVLRAPGPVSKSFGVPRPSEAVSSGKRVLLVEDVLPLQLVLKAKLERLGYSADLVKNGREAVDAVQRGDYALILMDIQMPELDGVSATRAIRTLPDAAKAATPIIALTANAMKGDEAAYLEAGMNAYLTKPVDTAQLAAELGRWLPDGGAPVRTPPVDSTTRPGVNGPLTEEVLR